MKKFIVIKQYKSDNTLQTVVAWFDDYNEADTFAKLSMKTDTAHKYWVFRQD